jgi:hypothetical protein
VGNRPVPEWGKSGLAGLGGTEIGSDEQLGEICALEVSPLAKPSWWPPAASAPMV